MMALIPKKGPTTNKAFTSPPIDAYVSMDCAACFALTKDVILKDWTHIIHAAQKIYKPAPIAIRVTGGSLLESGFLSIGKS